MARMASSGLSGTYENFLREAAIGAFAAKAQFVRIAVFVDPDFDWRVSRPPHELQRHNKPRTSQYGCYVKRSLVVSSPTLAIITPTTHIIDALFLHTTCESKVVTRSTVQAKG